jgi:Na+/H+ antiporter NhaD/arsenite permease-like protein
MQPIPIVVLFVVFALIVVRRVGNVRIQIWQAMLVGAVAVLVTLQISPVDALGAINLDVMVFLFGMFVVGEALEESGYLEHLSHRFLRSAKSVDRLVLLLIFGIGLASALLMNDTLAIIGTPMVLLLAKRHSLPPKMLLLALAFAVTIGSVMSPIGNPQNLLIAVEGEAGGVLANPFVTFLVFLLLPTLINLLVAYAFLRYFYKGSFGRAVEDQPPEPIRDPWLATLVKAALVIILAMIAVKVAIVLLGWQGRFDLHLTYIALAGAAPILLLSPKRVRVVKGVDWATLVFFASMFVLMRAVWDADFFQPLIEGSGFPITSLALILGVSVLLSQLISNVPMVALYLPMLLAAGAGGAQMVALAAGSTIAGNLTILGAASNVIIIQNAERKGGETLTFWEFARIGVPLTAVNVAVYWAFLAMM